MKRSLECKLDSLKFHDPNAIAQERIPQRNSTIQGRSKSHSEIPRSCSPIIKSQRSSDILNPITHEIVLNSSNGRFRICRCCPCPLSERGGKKVPDGPYRSRRPTTTKPLRKTHHVDCNECNISSSSLRVSVQTGYNNNLSTLICHKYGEELKCVDVVKAYHVSKHSSIA